MRSSFSLLVLILLLSACTTNGGSVGIVGFLETTEARMDSPEFDIPLTGPQAQETDYPAPPSDDDDDLDIPDTPVPFDPSDPTSTQPPDEAGPDLDATTTALFESAVPTGETQTPTPDLTGSVSPTVSVSPSLEITPTETRTPSPTATETVSPTVPSSVTPDVTGTVEPTPPAEPERDSFLGEPMLFTELAGYEVRNLNGNDIGGVNGMIYDSLSGQARYAVLAPTWALGINRGTVPVPWGAFNLTGETFYSAQAGILLLPVDDHVLSTGPTLDRSLWQGRSPPGNWDAGIADYWVNFVPIIPVTGDEDVPNGAPFLVSGPLLTTGPFFSGLDTDVTSVNGDIVAEIKDFILDADGAINYAVVLVDDTFGLGGRLAPVPFERLVWSPGGWFIFQGSPTTLTAAPGYASRSDFPNFSLPAWDADIRGYWAEK